MTDDAAISYLAAVRGTPVLSSTGTEIGTLEHVLQVPEVDVFDGIVIATKDGLRFIDLDGGRTRVELLSEHADKFSRDMQIESGMEAGLQDALAIRSEREAALATVRTEYDELSMQLRKADEQRLEFERSLQPLRDSITKLQLEEQAAQLGGAQYMEQLVAAEVDLELLGKSIDMLELSVRAKNCLDSENITILRDLVSMTEAELLKVRNFGKTSLKEVKSKLQALGLTLGLDVEEYSA